MQTEFWTDAFRMGEDNPSPGKSKDKYENKAIRWSDKGDHYELIFTDYFTTPSSAHSHDGECVTPGSSLLTDVICDMKAADKQKELHVFIGSFGGQVVALSMVLQQVLQFEHRVGINLGAACSCGWKLLFACQERYVSPYSQALYHDMSVCTYGKHTEIRNQNLFMDRWQKELNKVTDTEKVLTAKEIELGHTSEVWFTGQELIDRGAARDYKEYAKRKKPITVSDVVDVNGTLYKRDGEKFVKLEITKDEPVSYADLLTLCNALPEQEVKKAKK